MTGDSLLRIVVILFPLSEAALSVLRRARGGIARHADQGSIRVLWLVILGSVTLAVIASMLGMPPLPASRRAQTALALSLMLSGMAVRWIAIVSLGRFFTVDVAIHDQHALVDSGLYRYVRHPSYTGLLLAFAGLGVYFGNWLSLALATVPVTAALLSRIGKEEAALLEGLGAEYAAYCARTPRLVPGLY